MRPECSVCSLYCPSSLFFVICVLVFCLLVCALPRATLCPRSAIFYFSYRTVADLLYRAEFPTVSVLCWESVVLWSLFCPTYTQPPPCNSYDPLLLSRLIPLPASWNPSDRYSTSVVAVASPATSESSHCLSSPFSFYINPPHIVPMNLLIILLLPFPIL